MVDRLFSCEAKNDQLQHMSGEKINTCKKRFFCLSLSLQRPLTLKSMTNLFLLTVSRSSLFVVGVTIVRDLEDDIFIVGIQDERRGHWNIVHLLYITTNEKSCTQFVPGFDVKKHDEGDRTRKLEC